MLLLLLFGLTIFKFEFDEAADAADDDDVGLKREDNRVEPVDARVVAAAAAVDSLVVFVVVELYLLQYWIEEGLHANDASRL